MITKRFLLIYILSASLLLSSCQGGAQSPVSPRPANDVDISNSEAPAEETSTPATVAQMYPPESLDQTTAYPAWGAPTVDSGNLQPPTSANTPSDGKTSLSGLLFAFDISVPLSNMDFVLIPAVINGGVAMVPPILTYGNPLEGDILGRTDGDGVFFLDDIMPGKYFLLVNYPDHSEIAVDPNNTSAPLLFDLKADSAYPFGIILING